ncbi:MAG TPA: hypothetical protein VJY34_27480 [Roseiarcus sp.]|nr:hypothetical protein [Roseiarcus sp.]
MTDKLEKRLIEALESVEAHGDVAPVHVHDPMTMLLRENAIQAHLMRWDEARDRYVLTGTGRRRLGAESRAPSSLSDLAPHSLISLSFSSFLINKKRNNISMLRVSKTSSPTGC